jgi:hypothetical protein
MAWYDDYWELAQDDDPPDDEPWNDDPTEDEPPSDVPVDVAIQPLKAGEILSSATTILDAVDIFSSNPNTFFYVIHINQIIGVLFYKDLFKPLGRLAFLALALEVEDQALALCRSSKINKRCWESISDDRKRKATDLFKLRYGREPVLIDTAQPTIFQMINGPADISSLIGCTNLVDKATMIWKQRLIPPAKRADVLGFFNDLKEVRDKCAHPGDAEELLPKERVAHFVNSAKRMRANLGAAFQNLTSTENSPALDSLPTL